MIRKLLNWLFNRTDIEDETETVTPDPQAVTRIYSGDDFVVFLKPSTGRDDD